MRINRREFLTAATGAAIGIAPLSKALGNNQNEPININSYNAKRTIWLHCAPLSNLPKLYSESIIEIQDNPKLFSEVIDKYSKAYPIRKWPELKKMYPDAFTGIGYPNVRRNVVEENAQYIVELEIADRAIKYYLKEITRIAPNCNKEYLDLFLNSHLFPKVRSEVERQKGINKNLKISDMLDIINRTPGIFTSYTEEEANEILKEVTKQSPRLVLQSLVNKYLNIWNKTSGTKFVV